MPKGVALSFFLTLIPDAETTHNPARPHIPHTLYISHTFHTFPHSLLTQEPFIILLEPLLDGSLAVRPIPAVPTDACPLTAPAPAPGVTQAPAPGIAPAVIAAPPPPVRCLAVLVSADAALRGGGRRGPPL